MSCQQFEIDWITARNARTTDPVTSALAAASVTTGASHRDLLLAQYARAGDAGLTDEEAATRAGLLGCGYWKRCSELRRLGQIRATGELRQQSSGRLAVVCARIGGCNP